MDEVKAGSSVWVLERRDDGDAYDVSGYMFLAKVANYVILSSFVGDIEDLDGTLAYLSEETANYSNADLLVFPADDCFLSESEAHIALSEQGQEDLD